MNKLDKLEAGHRLDDEKILIRAKRLHETHITLMPKKIDME